MIKGKRGSVELEQAVKPVIRPDTPLPAEAEERTILIQRSLRCGQSVHYEGNVVVLGDVHPGAEVVAGGNVVVMGKLQGVVHAGAGGDEQAVVAALRLQPTQLRIAGHITRPPDEQEAPAQQPEVARVLHGTVVIEQYQPGGIRLSGQYQY